jgi:aspartyl-tRNA(Asn)/glutamyl-tRNA(Gln) amidotransferase subunit B
MTEKSSWQTVIGLEIHVQLATQSKIFSPASTAFGAPPNTQACAIDLGLPGILPVLNKEAVRMAVKFGLSTQATINKKCIFARKNYFYPDLPKGYQITQDQFPIVSGGMMNITLEDRSIKTIGITRAHLEEDAGKSMHDSDTTSGLDFNRAGMPLLEIVSEPDLRSSAEAVAYLKEVHRLVQFIEISTANMQEGAFRCDANVSVRLSENHPFGTRAEVKNINSFRFVQKAIDYEVQRQIDLLTHGEQIVQETRLYDANKNETRTMRTKENANDYRYFPDPDLPPLIISQEYIDAIKKTLPELPWERCSRFIRDFQLSTYDANLLCQDRSMADYFEHVMTLTKAPAKLVVNIITSELLALLNKDNKNITESNISTDHLAQLITRIHDNTISTSIAKTVIEAMWDGEGSPDQIIQTKRLKQITNPLEIEAMVDDVIADYPEQIMALKQGKDKIYGFLIGQIMKKSRGKADPAQVNQLLKNKLTVPTKG